MTRFRVASVAMVLAAIAISTGGCNDPKDVKIKELQAAVDDRDRQLADARAQYAQESDSANALRQQLASKDDELNRVRGQKSGGAVGGGATGSGTASGWEQGLVGDRVTIESDLLFSAGKAELTAAGKGKLDKIADDLKRKYSGMPVLVYGYTDTDPIRKTKNLWKDNLDLSSNRAMEVTRYLISKGVRPALIDSVGRGEWHPLANNKIKSRRVEIVVLKKSGPGPSASAMP